ncbi:hypothetical protein Y032_0009g695 [Ancylostoma ceylanicum]|uniref:Helix-turn-helix domain-containing protein n=1 Tax=Ancylostoma ceylanicum TaxID=53326 RepID=A0A016VK23_9BILA|nr:hypothetical protein Y032_0009g695 [Ancylostoma ceylanicum]
MKWYRKESSKNILAHAKSAHPVAIRRAVIRNMFKTDTMVCTGDRERYESRKMASQIASSNGYSVSQHSCKHHFVNRYDVAQRIAQFYPPTIAALLA